MSKKNKRENKYKELFVVDGDVLLKETSDRRALAYVPDPSGQRSAIDRRGKSIMKDDSFTSRMHARRAGIRYHSSFSVRLQFADNNGKYTIDAKAKDISDTGILLELSSKDDFSLLKGNISNLWLRFHLRGGVMPEGREMHIRTAASIVRTFERDGEMLVALQFAEDLGTFENRHKDRYLFLTSIICLFFISFTITLMRAESVIYYKYNVILYTYSIIAATFLLTRYLFGALYKPVSIDMSYQPSVTIIIPCFNEQHWIDRTITSCMNQVYPLDKLEVIVVDDCSTDRSVEVINQTIQKLCASEDTRLNVRERLHCLVQDKNSGKRAALCRGLDFAKGELVVFVDSDSFLDPYAIVNLIQPFRDPKMGGVAGRTDVANTYTNGLTKMQSVRYYIAFRVLKSAEALFDTVTCLSGPLSCYRKELVVENKEKWMNQRFLGHKATFGDDRAMTNFILSKHRTSYQDTAVCSTIVPHDQKIFLKQQMRWKRSWLRETLMAGSFMWKKEPFASVLFFIGLIVPLLSPFVVIYNLFYVPFTQHIFPTTFLVGLLLMALMMTISQLLLRKSTTWVYGFLFCIYYEAILLWQMPIAICTFWKSTWGTRQTKSDVEAAQKRRLWGHKKVKKTSEVLHVASSKRTTDENANNISI